MCRKVVCVVSFIVVLSMVDSVRGQLGQGVLYEYWFDIPGTAVDALTSDPRYPDSPDQSEWRTDFDSELNPWDNYGTRARGYIYPPVSGDYNLWISGDDFCELWLSTDDDPANITMVASVPGWSAQYEWGKYPEQKSNVITLQAGQRYYVEALMKEAGGGDTLTVGWGGPSIGEGPVIIEGKYLEPFITSFAEVMRTAREPNPADGSFHHDTWASMTWTAGYLAASHDVYFSDNLADVQARAADVFLGNQTLTDFVAGFPGFPFPDGLVAGTTYYWVIDEIEADGTKVEGNIWSFQVPPKTAYNPDPVDGAESVDPNVALEWAPGFGALLHYVYFGEDFDTVSNATGAMPWGAPNFKPGPLELGKVFYWRIDAFHGFETLKGDVWSFSTPGAVGSPEPANGAVDVKQTQVLTWVASDNATSHEVYFGTEKDAVRSADTGSSEYKGSKTIGSESHDPGKLEWDSTYYWRVDEVEAGGTQKGIVWSFTTANFLIVDDMEAYNDLDPADPASNRIFNAWLDGFGDATNGSLVGYDNPPFAEQTNVHSGSQSMPMSFDNSAALKSEATLTLTYPTDWTEKGVDTLTIWFRGASANSLETLYVAVNGNAVVDNDNPDASKIGAWTEWNIALQSFADQGVNLTNVNTLTLGLRSVDGGTGIIYFDDIRLYPPGP
ncbi:MAG: PA14 domain-containing protein [Planctomycetota bacterium]